MKLFALMMFALLMLFPSIALSSELPFNSQYDAPQTSPPQTVEATASPEILPVTGGSILVYVVFGIYAFALILSVVSLVINLKLSLGNSEGEK